MWGMCIIFPGINQGIVVMDEKVQNSISTKELCREYDWYENTFPSLVQDSCDDFFSENFDIKFIGLSKNINCLTDNEACFVTKIRISKDYDMFFRLTDKAISIILNTVLGQSKNKFNINKMSELEAKIITSFNSTLYDALKDKLLKPQATELKRSDFNVINLTFIIRNKEELDKTAGKIIITLPESLLDPDDIEPSGDKFSNENFPNSETIAKILVGKTKFSLYDLKHLEMEDVVVFEDSNIKQLKLSIDDTEMDVNISPNMELLIPDIDNEGDEDMGETHKNIWDSIEVEMYAEFDSVKITLGELKNIEDGLVVDLTSLYDNNVTLKVEGKPIASGSLVIVNDRYGVKINNVIAQENGSAPVKPQNNSENEEGSEDNQYDENSGDNYEEENDNNYSDESSNEEGDEEFDYSDFELEDENI